MKSSHGITIIAVLVALGIGWLSRGWLSPAPPHGAAPGATSPSPCPGGAAPLYWKAPMDPTFIRNQHRASLQWEWNSSPNAPAKGALPNPETCRHRSESILRRSRTSV